MENINEGFATNYIKKNKVMFSKLEKFFLNKVHIGGKVNNQYVIFNKRCRINAPLKLIYPKIKYKGADSSFYIYFDLVVIADLSVKTYSKDNLVWVGYEFSKIGLSYLKSSYGNPLVNFIYNALRDDVYDSYNVDLRSDINLAKDLIEAFKDAGLLLKNNTVDNTTDEQITGCLEQIGYSFIENLSKNLASKYENDVQKILDSLADKIKVSIDKDYFTKCDKRENFIPIIEIDSSNDKVWCYDTPNPYSPRACRLNYSNLEVCIKALNSNFDALYSGILESNLFDIIQNI